MRLKAWTEEAERLRAQELEALFNVASILVAPGDIEQKVTRVLEEIASAVGSEWVILRLFDEDDQVLRLVSHVGSGLEDLPPDPVLLPGQLLSGKAFEKGEPLVVNDVRSYPDTSPARVAQGMRSAASLLLKSGDRLIGTVQVNSGQLNHFTPERVKFVTAIVDGIGVLLDNARLLEGVRESEERYRNLFEESRDAIFVISEDGEKLTGVNQTALDLFGFTREEAIGSSIGDRFVDPADWVAATREIDKAGYVRDFGVGLRKTDGSEILCLMTFSRRLDGEGRSLGFQGVIRDVTERVEAEEAERLRTQELEALFTVASILVAPGDIEQKVTHVLEAIAAAVEADWVVLRLYDEEEQVLRLVSYVGAGLQDLPPEPVLQLGQLVSGQAFQRGEPLVVNDYPAHPGADAGRVAEGMKSAASLILKSGDRLIGTVQVSSKQLDHFTPERVKFLTAIVDGMGVLLENARLLEGVRESEERYRNLFEESRDAIFVIAADCKVMAANQAAVELFGFEMQDAGGSEVIDRFVDPGDPERFRRAIDQSGSVRDFEVKLRDADGSEIDCLVTATRRLDARGRSLGLQGVIRDITERKRIQREGSVLAEIGVVLGGTLAIEEVYQQFADQVQKLIPSDRVVISDVDIDAGTITPVYIAGLPIDGWPPDTPHLLASTPLENVVRYRTPLVMNFGESERLAQAYGGLVDGLEAGLRSGLAVPLIARDSTIGILSLRRIDSGGYTPRELELAIGVANQIAPAIENARLYREAGVVAVHEERNRLARDLHDSVIQSLYSLTLHSEASVRHANAGDLEQVKARLGQMGESALQALKEMRLLVYQLRPPLLEDEGLIGALQHRLDAVEKRSGVKTRLILDREYRLPANIENALFPVAIEALNNAIKHANASIVEMRINTVDGGIELTVRDNGRGFAVAERSAQGGVGLASMSERLSDIGGRLSVKSVVGEGTTVTAFVGLDLPDSGPSDADHPDHQGASA